MTAPRDHQGSAPCTYSYKLYSPTLTHRVVLSCAALELMALSPTKLIKGFEKQRSTWLVGDWEANAGAVTLNYFRIRARTSMPDFAFRIDIE